MKKTPALFKTILLTITIVLFASIALFTYVLYSSFTDNVSQDLKQDAYLISASMPKDNEEDYLSSLELSDDTRITWIDQDGTVLYDSKKDASKMENHASRPEVREAFLNGEGESIRKSTTLSRQTIYYAMSADNNKVLRISRSYDSLFILMLRLVSPVLWVLIFGLIASIILKNWVNKYYIPHVNEV